MKERSNTHVEILDPKNLGFEPRGNGWKKEMPELGEVAFAKISWQHIQMTEGGINPLELTRQLQGEVWEMPDADTVPTNALAIIEDTGGATLVAYDPKKGYTPDGWYGFLFGFGSSSGQLVSHMMGVREDLRGKADIGTNLKVLQTHEAIKTGHTSIKWTFDPFRSLNANLNFSKLGGIVNTFTVDKYGKLNSDLYGDVPTDRFTVELDLRSPEINQRLMAAIDGTYKRTTLDDVIQITEVDSQNIDDILEEKPTKIKYEIPADIDLLSKTNGEKAVQWRREMRNVFSKLLDTEKMVNGATTVDPAMINVETTKGDYYVSGFSTGRVDGERKSYYIFDIKIYS